MKQGLRIKAKQAVRLLAAIEASKSLYEKLDVLTEELRVEGFKNLPLKDGILLLVDNFSERNVAFRTTGVRRYELKMARSKK